MRVKYYSRNDFCYGLSLNRIESIEIQPFDRISISDAIEYYEIKRYFDDEARIETWTNEECDFYKTKAKELFGLTMRFFNSLDDENIIAYFNEIDLEEHEAFWNLFEKCKLYNKISESVFDELIHSENFIPGYVFSHKLIVDRYGSAIRSFVMENPDLVKIVLSALEDFEESSANKAKDYIPAELSEEDIYVCINAYIDSDHPSCSVLERILYLRSKGRFQVSDELRLKAKRRYDMEREIVLDKGVSFQYGIRLNFSADQKEEKIVTKDGDEYRSSYSLKWLQETLDYPSILNNFIYLFEFADIKQMRCNLVATESQPRVFERLFLPQSQHIYPKNFVFNFLNSISVMQIGAYYVFLKENGIRFEDVLTWFFTKYLQEEFQCPEMRVSFPSDGASYAEKCSSIIGTIDAALKQFDLYVSHKKIDFDLVKMQSGSKRIGDIPSLLDGKYLYPGEKDCSSFENLLFSDQSPLLFVKRIIDQKKEYTDFFSLFSKEKIYLSDYSEREQYMIAYLKENDLVEVDGSGQIAPGNMTKLAIVKDLFTNDVISRWHYPPDSYPIIQEWIEKEHLKEGRSLLSKPEAAFFDYLLNDAQYTNGLELRNKYAHGNQQVIDDEKEHMHNYFIFLQICTIIAIKINDDFCLYEQKQKELQKLSNPDNIS